MRVLVCGGRDFTDYEALAIALGMANLIRGPFSAVIHGNAKGADALAGQWARAKGIKEMKFTAQWALHGAAAGPIRNARMLKEGKPQRVIAFPGGIGTADMIAKAKAARIPVWEVKMKSRKIEAVA